MNDVLRLRVSDIASLSSSLAKRPWTIDDVAEKENSRSDSSFGYISTATCIFIVLSAKKDFISFGNDFIDT